MAKKTPDPLTPADQAADFAERLESTSQAIGWLQVQDAGLVASAEKKTGFQYIGAELPQLRAIAMAVKLLQLTGPVEETPAAEAPAAPAPVEKQKEIPPAKHEPWTPVDYAALADKFTARIIAEAEAEESNVPAEIMKLRDRVARLHIAVLKLEQMKKSTKDMLDLAVEELDTRQGEHRQAEEAKNRPLPLIDNAEKSGSDGWREVAISTLNLKPGVVKALAEHEPHIETLGALSDFQKEKGEWWAKEITGIGEVAVESIVAAMEKFWADHPEYTTAGAEAEESEELEPAGAVE